MFRRLTVVAEKSKVRKETRTLHPIVYRGFVFLCLLAISSHEEYREYVRAVLRADAFQVVFGSLIVLIGIAAVSIFVVRKRQGDRALIWFGVFALLYGTRLSLNTSTIPFVLSLSESSVEWWSSVLTYVMPIPGTLFGYEILPASRLVLRWVLGFLIAFALSGIVVDLGLGRPGTLHLANNVVTLINWLVVGTALFRYGKSLPFFRALKLAFPQDAAFPYPNPVDWGVLKVDKSLKTEFETTIPWKNFNAFITAEDGPSPSTPSATEVLRATIQQ